MGNASTETCVVEGCARGRHRKGYCNMHYQRVWRHGDPGLADPMRGNARDPVCSIEGCERPHVARGWCRMHYRRWRLEGDPGEADARYECLRGCEVLDCPERHFGRGYCLAHYSKFRYHGTPTPSVGSTRESRIKVLHAMCKVCGETKPADDFRISYTAAHGLKSQCMTCDVMVRRWRDYGLSAEQVLAAYEAQAHRCAICGEEGRLSKLRGLVVDHDHATGVFRGLLCHLCNTFIGLAKEDPVRLVRAVEYLKDPSG